MDHALFKDNAILKDSMFSRIGKTTQIQCHILINHSSASTKNGHARSRSQQSAMQKTQEIQKKSALMLRRKIKKKRATSSFSTVDRMHTTTAFLYVFFII